MFEILEHLPSQLILSVQGNSEKHYVMIVFGVKQINRTVSRFE